MPGVQEPYKYKVLHVRDMVPKALRVMGSSTQGAWRTGMILALRVQGPEHLLGSISQGTGQPPRHSNAPTASQGLEELPGERMLTRFNQGRDDPPGPTAHLPASPGLGANQGTGFQEIIQGTAEHLTCITGSRVLPIMGSRSKVAGSAAACPKWTTCKGLGLRFWTACSRACNIEEEK